MTKSLRYSSLWWWLYNTRSRLKFVLTGDCGHACDWAQPYGWVPEDGCPVHDVKHKANRDLGGEGTLWVSTPTDTCLGDASLWPKP